MSFAAIFFDTGTVVLHNSLFATPANNMHALYTVFGTYITTSKKTWKIYDD